jgi:mRNA-degrading endonuclease RelE of RelBE toxin-antitoxin system
MLPALLSSRSRTLVTLVAGFATVAALSLPGDALAKKSKKKGKQHVQLTGVKSLDKVFKPLKKLDKSITKAQKARREGAASINAALGLKKGTSLPAAIKHLQREAKGKVKVTMSGGSPQLKATDALPTNIQEGIKAVNVVISSYSTAVKELASAPKQAQQLVKQAQKLPDALKQELTSNPAEAITIMRNLGVVKDNIKIAAQLPKRATTVTRNLNQDLKVIVVGFGGKWPPI